MGEFDELLTVGGVLHDLGFTYWLDSGTLLGMVREGRLLSSDHDIDVSAWWDPRLDYSELRRRFLELGYEVRLHWYQGYLFKFWLQGGSSRAPKRSVDLRFFRVHDDRFAWSPRVERLDHFSGLPRPFRWVVRKAWVSSYRIWQDRLRGRVPGWTWPAMKLLASVHCWWVPARYFKEFKTLDNGLPVPRSYEDYLTYRYGNWEVPVSDWNFKRDDPTYLRLRPEEVFQRASSSSWNPLVERQAIDR